MQWYIINAEWVNFSFCTLYNAFAFFICFITFWKQCTVGTESIQTPLNFSLFIILQPFAKII